MLPAREPQSLALRYLQECQEFSPALPARKGDILAAQPNLRGGLHEEEGFGRVLTGELVRRDARQQPPCKYLFLYLLYFVL